jgi:hypothetical protein
VPFLQLLYKNISAPGLDASYTFSLKASYDLLDGQSALFVEFPVCLPPRLNSKQGYVDCLVDAVSSMCTVVAERRVRIALPFNIVAGKQFLLTISGVTQPS